MKKCLFSLLMIISLLLSVFMISCSGNEYTVRYYQELSEGTYVDTKIEKLISYEDIINFEPTEQEHYTINRVKSKLTGDFSSDEAVIIEVYYDANRYTVIFEIGELELVSGELTQSVFYNTNAVAPVVKDSEKAKFVSWDTSFDKVSSNITVKANCNTDSTIKVYHKYENIDGTYSVKNVETLTVDASLGDYTHSPEEVDHYNINEELSVLTCSPSVIEEKAIEIYYERKIYNVMFELNGLDLISGDLEQSVKSGGEAIAPVIANTSKVEFISWNKKFSMVESDLIVKANVNSLAKVKVDVYKETLTGEYIKESELNIFVDALKGDYTYSPNIIEHYVVNHSMSELDCTPTILNVENLSVYYDLKRYTVKFEIGNLEYVSGDLEQTVPYGSSAIAPFVNNTNTSSFLNWDKSFDNVSSDITVKAVCSTEAKVNLITYSENLNGEYFKYSETQLFIDTLNGEYTHTPNIMEHYVINLDKSELKCIPSVLNVETITLYYDLKRYTVKFEIGDLSHISGSLEQTIPYGGSAIAPVVSGTRISAFQNWDKVFENISSDLTVKAICTSEARITVVNYIENLAGGYSELERQTINVSALPETYTLNPAPKTNYTVNELLSNKTCALQAGLEQTLNVYYDLRRYTVTFQYTDLSLVSGEAVQTIPHGGSAIAPVLADTLTVKFNKWSEDFNNVTSDLNVVAVVDVYKTISTRSDLECIGLDTSGNYILTADIDLSTGLWTPLGSFNGKFLGNGHTIKGIKFSNQNNVGLFTQNAGLIDGLTILNCSIDFSINNATGGNVKGAFIASENYGLITNCTVKGTNTITYKFACSYEIGCYTDGAFTHYKFSNTYKGATLACINLGTIENCSLEGNINYSVTSDLYYKYNTWLYTNAGNGSMTLNAYASFGGFCADNLGTIKSCISSANIKSTSVAKAVSDTNSLGRNDVYSYTNVTFGSVCAVNQKVIDGCKTLVGTIDSSSKSTNCDEAHAGNNVTSDSSLKYLVGTDNGTITNSIATTS